MKTVVRMYERFDDAERTADELARAGLDDRQIGLVTTNASARNGRHRMSAVDLPELGRIAATERMLRLLDAKRRPNGVIGALAALGVPEASAER